jgi:hypothetical protein
VFHACIVRRNSGTRKLAVYGLREVVTFYALSEPPSRQGTIAPCPRCQASLRGGRQLSGVLRRPRPIYESEQRNFGVAVIRLLKIDPELRAVMLPSCRRR